MARNPNSKRHKWEREGKWEKKCVKCGCIRTDEPGYHRQYVLGDYNEFKAPECITNLEAMTISEMR